MGLANSGCYARRVIERYHFAKEIPGGLVEDADRRKFFRLTAVVSMRPILRRGDLTKRGVQDALLQVLAAK
jgi:hypothetical protein